MSRSNCQSLSSLSSSLPAHSPFELVKADTGLKFSRNSSITNSESSEGEVDEYVTALRRIIKRTSRDPRSRESSLAICSGPAAGPLACRLCSGEGESITASQLFWEKTV